MGRPKKIKNEQDQKSTANQSANTEPNNIIFDKITESLQKQFGDNVILSPANKDAMDKRVVSKNIIPTDSISFNTMTGCGGLPKGRIFLVTGRAGVGKSTSMLACYKNARKEGYILIYCDIEHRLDLGLLDSMGIDRFDKDYFRLILPNTADEVFVSINDYLSMNRPLFIVMDSMTALKIKIEQKKANYSWGDGRRPGQDASMISEFLRVITPALSKTHSILGIISQERMKNIVGYAYKGATGGLAPEFYATYILTIKNAKDGEIMKGEQQVGQELVMQFDKTTTSLPPQPRKVALHYGKGFYLEYETVQIGIQKGLIKVNGHWFEYDGQKYNGLMNLVETIETNKDLFKKIKKEIE